MMRLKFILAVIFLIVFDLRIKAQCPADIFNPGLTSSPVTCFGGSNGEVRLTYTSTNPSAIDFQLIDEITDAIN